MILGIPKEILDNELRVAALPETVAEYVKMGFEVLVQSSAGEGALRADAEYEKAGARIVSDPASLFAAADVIVKVKQPWLNQQTGKHEVEMMRPGAVLVSFLHPAAPPNHAMIRMLSAANITALTMDDIPRISRAQTMDALTSMSTVTGYKSVLLAANRFPKFVPMIGTAIGTIKAAKFLIVGIGVVGLQAIATAKRLGGSIKAVDIRDESRKAADSLGAQIAGFDVPPELAIGEGGYAKALPPEWIERERQAIGPYVEEADVVILSALVPGEIAPVLVTAEMLQKMKPGSVIVDVSIDQGGNCALTEPGRETTQHGVHLIGLWNIPGSMPVHASWLYAHNVLHYVRNLFKKGLNKPDLDDEIVRHSLVTHQGNIVHQGTLKSMNKG
ncbi:MAG: NADP oxidoreductase [Planctomycetes bacterium RBG_16_64_10]|nr:MAG: NADP oxidoreductase [Planctomycetes bacterium RBG_16_64_10]